MGIVKRPTETSRCITEMWDDMTELLTKLGANTTQFETMPVQPTMLRVSRSRSLQPEAHALTGAVLSLLQLHSRLTGRQWFDSRTWSKLLLTAQSDMIPWRFGGEGVLGSHQLLAGSWAAQACHSMELGLGHFFLVSFVFRRREIGDWGNGVNVTIIWDWAMLQEGLILLQDLKESGLC